MDTVTKRAVAKLAYKRDTPALLGDPPRLPVIRETVSLAKDRTDQTTGSGIASPLTEVSRTVYDTKSSDGIFVFSVPSSITFTDAAGTEVVLVLAQP